MTTRQLILLAAESQLEATRALASGLQGSWTFGACPECRVVPVSDGRVDELMHEACSLLLIPGAGEDASGNRRYLRALDHAHDASVPCLILGDIIDPARPDLLEILHMPMATPPATIAAILVGMLGRQGEINRIRMQLDTTSRVVTNVHEEMEKLDEELQAAAMVQRDFLPGALPKLGSISVGALWRPTSYVSGDYYDVRQIDDHRIGVFIVDAAGHGVPSALMTMLLARAFEFAWTREGDDPAAVMTSLNREFCLQQTGITRFATGVYAVVDCRTGTIRYSSAGHPPPLVLGPDQLNPLKNEDGGGLLGVFPDEEFEVMVERIAPGETLLLHSDGFEQAFPLPDASPTELTRPTTAYLNVFKSLGDLDDPTTMIDRISHAIDSRRGSLNPCDDLTLLCVHHARAGQALSAAG